MPHYVYILQSLKHQGYYCGSSADVDVRLQKHNSKATPSTKTGVPWAVRRIIICESKREALQLEIQIKKRGIGRWMNDHPE
ncbi:MAG: GIY-YIG nuclease family protein [Bacteroidetes bacterium]|uniref:GIY-YIG nuclease family protein n=1 Tax=Phnomibacter sp. TaxID=2836217 RepID=UPI002FDEC61B|nr:GIY-YIG nuclease family protein [Bacteroidota bacterium]